MNTIDQRMLNDSLLLTSAGIEFLIKVGKYETEGEAFPNDNSKELVELKTSRFLKKSNQVDGYFLTGEAWKAIGLHLLSVN